MTIVQLSSTSPMSLSLTTRFQMRSILVTGFRGFRVVSRMEGER